MSLLGFVETGNEQALVTPSDALTEEQLDKAVTDFLTAIYSAAATA